MAGSFLTVASRLAAAGYDPVLAQDIERGLTRLAERRVRSLLVAGPEGVVSWMVVGVDLEAMTATLVHGDRVLTAGPEDLSAIFGTAADTQLH